MPEYHGNITSITNKTEAANLDYIYPGFTASDFRAVLVSGRP